MNVVRLKYAIKALREWDAIAPHLGIQKFNMRWWKYNRPECGTSVCAGGYLASLPLNVTDGLHLTTRPDDPILATIIYNGHQAFYAISDFFDISLHEAETIFRGEQPNATPNTIADALQMLLDVPITIPERNRQIFFDASAALDEFSRGATNKDILKFRNRLIALGQGQPVQKVCKKT